MYWLISFLLLLYLAVGIYTFIQALKMPGNLVAAAWPVRSGRCSGWSGSRKESDDWAAGGAAICPEPVGYSTAVARCHSRTGLTALPDRCLPQPAMPMKVSPNTHHRVCS